MERTATGQTALRDSPPTTTPARPAAPDKCHGLTPRGSSCHAPTAAASRSATLTCTGTVA